MRILVLCFVFLLAGCQGRPLLQAGQTFDEPAADIEFVRTSILNAMVVYGWSPISETRNQIEGVKIIGGGRASIIVDYDQQSYSIRHLDSDGLGFDPSAQTIHKDFNHYIRILDESVQTRVNSLYQAR